MFGPYCDYCKADMDRRISYMCNHHGQFCDVDHFHEWWKQNKKGLPWDTHHHLEGRFLRVQEEFGDLYRVLEIVTRDLRKAQKHLPIEDKVFTNSSIKLARARLKECAWIIDASKQNDRKEGDQ